MGPFDQFQPKLSNPSHFNPAESERLLLWVPLWIHTHFLDVSPLTHSSRAIDYATLKE